VQDVLLGGQGAPPRSHRRPYLFAEYDCMNLGGFSNVSFEEKGNRIAFDISPVNTVLISIQINWDSIMMIKENFNNRSN
jgi:anhydro-N-acetylmuramic acid kinase